MRAKNILEIGNPRESYVENKASDLDKGGVIDNGRGSEKHREQIEFALLALLLESRKINCGNNGIILELNISEDVRQIMRESGINISEGDQVAKAFKVFSHGKGRHEYESQLFAHKVLGKYREKNADEVVALVPNPLFFELKNTPALSEKLTKEGVFPSDEYDIIVMDRVPGRDIAEILYSELIKRHPEMQYLQSGGGADSMSFEDLQREVNNKFFSIAERKPRRNQEEHMMVEEKVASENKKVLAMLLAELDFTFDQKIIETMEKSIQILRDAGLLMFDRHERNFMVTNKGDVYMIDFGETEMIGGVVSERDDRFFGQVNDMSVPRYLRHINSLTQSNREKLASLPKYFNDPRKRVLNMKILFRESDFRNGNVEALGMKRIKKDSGEGKKFIDSREQSREFLSRISEEIVRFKINHKFNIAGILKDFPMKRESSREDDDLEEKGRIKRNNGRYKNAYFGSVIYQVFESVKSGLINEDQFSEISEVLQNYKIQNKKTHEEITLFDADLWRGIDFSLNAYSLLREIEEEKKKNP